MTWWQIVIIVYVVSVIILWSVVHVGSRWDDD